MDGYMYPLSLAVVALMAFTFYQNNSFKMMLLMLGIGVYIIYSHETGYTATDYKNEVIESIDKSAKEFVKPMEKPAFQGK
ncbi:MAG: hypothetical protein PHX44_02910 [Sulfurimonas sp.]|uniref:hypothetical protein n=1 Tax=Sulfurimonas sp. TaxID=2022749 RepID=UPI0026118BA0|nr:hypothetical protein [Sulfurimonas sp.]MDD2651988.1 hypothetical protein [Sulfurimonas sp.]MDD3451886.1 hypothetical protein [Sulfurimonas sp.]